MIAQNRRYAYILGVGVQDLEDWDPTIAPLQIGGNGSLSATRASGAGGSIGLSQNAYYDDTDNRWEYQDTDEASYYYQINGTHVFNVAVSGTEDTAITWIQAVEISNSGDLAVRGTGSGTNNTHLTISNASTTATYGSGLWLDTDEGDGLRTRAVMFAALDGANGGKIVLRTRNAGSVTDAMIINATQDVSIPNGSLSVGLTSAVHNLAVASASDLGANIPSVWLHNSTDASERDGTVISTRDAGSDVEVLHCRAATTTYNGGTSLFLITGDGNAYIPNGNLILSNSSSRILQGTADGSDSEDIGICGGGALSADRGAYTVWRGNEDVIGKGDWTTLAGLGNNSDDFGIGYIKNSNGDIIMQFGDGTAATNADVSIPNGDLAVGGHLQFDTNDKYLYFEESGGTKRTALGLDSSNDLLIGNSTWDSKYYGLTHQFVSGDVSIPNGNLSVAQILYLDDGQAMRFTSDGTSTGTKRGAIAANASSVMSFYTAVDVLGLEISAAQDVSIPNGTLTVGDDIIVDSTGTAQIILDAGNTSSDSRLDFYAAGVSKGLIYYNHNATGTSETMNFTVNGTLALELNGNQHVSIPAGNVGIRNATLEGWHASYVALQFGSNASMMSPISAGAAKDLFIFQNAYYDGSYKYQDTDEASVYIQGNGAHSFRVAVSGTADTAISWTEALNISNAANVSIPNGSLSIADDVDGIYSLNMNNESVNAAAAVRINMTHLGGGDTYIRMLGGANWAIGADGSDSGFKVCKQANIEGSEKFVIDSSGNVSIPAGSLTASGGIDAGGSGTAIKRKVIDIGDWNMNLLGAGSATKTVAHGLTLANIIKVEVLIRNDANSSKYPLNYSGKDVNVKSGGTGDVDIPLLSGEFYADGTNIQMKALYGKGTDGGSNTAGFFTTTDFDSTSYNRGWITILYA